MITGSIIDPINPDFLQNTPRHIYFEESSTSKQNIWYNTYFSPKKVLESELPALSYVPNRVLCLFSHTRKADSSLPNTFLGV